MLADGYYLPPFEYRFEINTPIPYHAEIHINRTLFDYEGEYFIIYQYTHLRPNFVINVNGMYCMSVAHKIILYAIFTKLFSSQQATLSFCMGIL